MPFKGLGGPKRRLGPLLSLAERRTLALAMLRDVMAAVNGALLFERVLLVSRDERALALAADLGAVPLVEHGSHGYSAAADQASQVARAGGAEALLVLPGDVPLTRPADLQALVCAVGTAEFGLVPAESGDGTNAVLVRPPGALQFRFGRGSFLAHRRQASALGECRVVELPNLALDLDTPDDLRVLLAATSRLEGTATGRYLRRSGLAERLTRPAGSVQ